MQNRYFLPVLCFLIKPLVCPAQDPGGTAGATGNVTGTYRGASVTYTTVRAKDGWVWLRQNLGSTQVAGSATDAASYGDLFQWGRWDDGHQVRNPANVVDGMPSPNNPAGLNLSGDNPFYKGGGITWYNDGTVADRWAAPTPSAATANNGCDPCKQIFGSNWQLPSLQDWQTVLAAEGANNVATGFASTLKLPAAGGRNELLGSLSDEGIAAIYWSNNAEPGSAPQAMYINLSLGNLADYNYRGIGMSIRCLKKSLPTLIKENKNGSSLLLFPNPAQTEITLVMNTSLPTATIQVMNILGKVLHTQEVKNTSQPVLVPLTGLADGMYFLQLNDSRENVVRAFSIKR